MSRLLVEFCGEERAVEHRLGVGRAADLVIDDNPYLHREVLRFVRDGGTWWVHTTGSRVVVTVDDGAGSSATLGPGASAALVAPTSLVRFAAGPARYELSATLEDHERDLDLFGPAVLGGTRTLEWGRVGLNDDQRLLLLALCEHRLRNPSDRTAPPPTNRSAARRLGWSPSKYNRKLDHLCEKLARAGVAGVHGDVALLAADRRRVLIDHAVEVGLVNVTELGDLDPPAV
ncbi:MAG: hypothetical protein ACOYOP_05280 [Microthrixaceae bacterium]